MCKVKKNPEAHPLIPLVLCLLNRFFSVLFACFTARSQLNYQADLQETWCQRKTNWILEQIKNDSVDTKHQTLPGREFGQGRIITIHLALTKQPKTDNSILQSTRHTPSCSSFMKKAEHALEQWFHGELLLQRQQGLTVKLRSGRGNINTNTSCNDLFWYNWFLKKKKIQEWMT